MEGELSGEYWGDGDPLLYYATSKHCNPLLVVMTQGPQRPSMPLDNFQHRKQKLCHTSLKF